MSTTIDRSSPSTEIAFGISGMDCASCVAHVEKAARKINGVQTCDVNLARGRARVRFDPEKTTPDEIASAITRVGYPAKAEDHTDPQARIESQRLHRQREEAHAWLRRAIAGIILWFPVEAAHWVQHLTHHHAAGADWLVWLSLCTSTIGIFFVGAAFYRSAIRALARGTSNMDTLIAMGASVAYIYSLIALIGNQSHDWPLPDLYFMESTGLLALISLGHWMESRARQSAGSAIHELLNLAPTMALRLQNTGSSDADFTSVPLSDVQINDVLLIRPGDRVPIDGMVIDGHSSVDESMITGEPLPATRRPGDSLIGGTQNVDGAMRLRVTNTGGQTALAQIIQLVEQAQSSKPAVQKLADQIAAIFVPTVLCIALATGIGWYLWGHLHHWENARLWAQLAKSVCSVLIIACPCALGLAVPAALMVGTGLGAKRGILIRDIDALQTAEKIETIVLDKTGTITQGKPVVSHVEATGNVSADEILRLAAAAEQYSEHPLAKAIVAEARRKGIEFPDPESFKNEPGSGVVAQIAGQQIVIGSRDFLQATGGEPKTSAPGGTHVYLGQLDDGKLSLLGIITLSDALKPDSADAVAALHRMGLRTVLLSGDNEITARTVAKQVGINDVHANVKPADKATVIRALQNPKSPIQNPKWKVSMVGDGINDAPALAQADLGIAIGSGSDVAKEAGDIVLVGGSLHGIATAIHLSRATMRTIRQNLFFAFIYNILAIPLAALGFLNPLIAAGAMALSDITVIGNALRLKWSGISRK